MPKQRRATKNRTQTGQLRIIGGQWRGRKLQFPAVEGLRPTADRVRETLFNWLAADIEGARVLDLFAGSGALGLEALSRGAAHCTFVERDRIAANSLRANLELLHCDSAQVIQASAIEWLQEATLPFDMVFLDPPFRLGLLEPACQALLENNLITSPGWLYLEMGKEELPPQLPPTLKLHREKSAGQTRYLLLSKHKY